MDNDELSLEERVLRSVNDATIKDPGKYSELRKAECIGRLVHNRNVLVDFSKTLVEWHQQRSDESSKQRIMDALKKARESINHLTERINSIDRS